MSKVALRITVEARSDDFMAFLNGDRSHWGCGKTPAAAIGDAILSHARGCGVAVCLPVKAISDRLNRDFVQK